MLIARSQGSDRESVEDEGKRTMPDWHSTSSEFQVHNQNLEEILVEHMTSGAALR